MMINLLRTELEKRETNNIFLKYITLELVVEGEVFYE
jgi:hypothetical protein